jgi:hypothetical protein
MACVKADAFNRSQRTIRNDSRTQTIVQFDHDIRGSGCGYDEIIPNRRIVAHLAHVERGRRNYDKRRRRD